MKICFMNNTKIIAKAKYLLWKMGIRKTIPGTIINNIPIRENNDPLVNISCDKSFFFSPILEKQKKTLVRHTVYQRLKEAQKLLPPGIHFKIFSAYRSLEQQQKRWDYLYKKNKKDFPNLSEEETINKTQSQIANPQAGFGGHQTGGAVDISLCNDQGQDLDMGTAYGEHNHTTFTQNKNLNKEQQQNRKILFDAMTAAGFTNYPAEWWHYSYGDRMWAAYSRNKISLYNLVDENQINEIDRYTNFN